MFIFILSEQIVNIRYRNEKVKRNPNFFISFLFLLLSKVDYLSFNSDFSINRYLQKKNIKNSWNLKISRLFVCFIHSCIIFFFLYSVHDMCIVLDIYWCFIFKNMCVYHGVYAWKREKGKAWGLVWFACVFYVSNHSTYDY